MTDAELPLHPEWFPAALDAARGHYKLIHTTRHTCGLCGVHVHIGRDPIHERTEPDDKGWYHVHAIPGFYAFCACCQWIGHPAGQTWEDRARIYHARIALPDSQEHKDNMLRGYPTTALIGLLIGEDR